MPHDPPKNPLETLLDLRRREEEAALATWGSKVEAQRGAEQEQERLDEGVRAAEERARRARERPLGEERAGDAVARESYLERLAGEIRRANEEAARHRAGALATAIAAARAARARYDEARRGREAVERHLARGEAAAAEAASHRDDDRASEEALAAWLARR